MSLSFLACETCFPGAFPERGHSTSQPAAARLFAEVMGHGHGLLGAAASAGSPVYEWAPSVHLLWADPGLFPVSSC